MIVIESECVDCGLPCIFESCKYYQVKRYYCDKCKNETSLYEFEGEQLCIGCIKKLLPLVEGSEIYDF